VCNLDPNLLTRLRNHSSRRRMTLCKPTFLATNPRQTASLGAHGDLFEILSHELAAGLAPSAGDVMGQRLEPLTIGLRQKIPILTCGARVFRVTNWCGKPMRTSDVGAPPSARASIGRLNDVGQSVLYVADSPDTAFAERRATIGEYCLSEWRSVPERLALANGGMPLALLRARFPNNLDPHSGNALGGIDDDQLLELFRRIFTIDVRDAHERYRWSIACGLACGFAHLCERTSARERDANTEWSGRYPFAGIAYASIRTDKDAINFALNDLGQTLLRLENVQWVALHADGSFSGLDFASSWGAAGEIAWQHRPARFQIPPGGAARVVKVAETVWRYETVDGSIPHFA
jgi:RES domain-containing protein